MEIQDIVKPKKRYRLLVRPEDLYLYPKLGSDQCKKKQCVTPNEELRLTIRLYQASQESLWVLLKYRAHLAKKRLKLFIYILYINMKFFYKFIYSHVTNVLKVFNKKEAYEEKCPSFLGDILKENPTNYDSLYRKLREKVDEVDICNKSRKR